MQGCNSIEVTMMDSEIRVLFELLKAGLWEKEARLSQYGIVDFAAVQRLAEEQSVVGLVTAGLEHVVDVKIPQPIVLQFIGSTLQIEQQNWSMNEFVDKLINLLRKNDVYALLVKGQGIAQCYDRPLWRASGDVDLLLSDTNYKKALDLLTPLASEVEKENLYNKHLSMIIEGWTVELHGTLRNGLWPSLDSVVDDMQNTVFYNGSVRSWMNGGTQVFLPCANEDVVFVFAHILQHFYREGIGIRQICDLCRLLWTYKGGIKVDLLKTRLKKAGVLKEWKAFGLLTVEYLGMPLESIPLLDKNDIDNANLKRKASRIMSFVLESGNFGHNRDYSYYEKYPYIIYKFISFWRHTKDGLRHFTVFPLNSVKVWMSMVKIGLRYMRLGRW